MRGVPPALLTASIHIEYILSLAAPSKLSDVVERQRWSKALLLVFEPWLRHTHPPPPSGGHRALDLLENKIESTKETNEEEGNENKNPPTPGGLNSITETIAREWCWNMYVVVSIDIFEHTSHRHSKTHFLWAHVFMFQ